MNEVEIIVKKKSIVKVYFNNNTKKVFIHSILRVT